MLSHHLHRVLVDAYIAELHRDAGRTARRRTAADPRPARPFERGPFTARRPRPVGSGSPAS